MSKRAVLTFAVIFSVAASVATLVDAQSKPVRVRVRLRSRGRASVGSHRRARAPHRLPESSSHRRCCAVRRPATRLACPDRGLDRDGLADVLVADAAANRIGWLRQAPAGQFTEQTIAEVAGPAHVAAVDMDEDADLDVLVASLGVIALNNAKIGSVIVLENDGRQAFTRRVLAENIARVSDMEAGDLDGDGDLDLAVAQFGYDQGETRWLENQGGWRFTSHVLQQLSGPINAVVADVDRDGDQDIVSLVSQEWEEVYVFVNDGRAGFTPKRIFGASNEDFGSSWISVVDLDGDRDVDVLYSNGDAFDYAPPNVPVLTPPSSLAKTSSELSPMTMDVVQHWSSGVSVQPAD